LRPSGQEAGELPVFFQPPNAPSDWMDRFTRNNTPFSEVIFLSDCERLAKNTFDTLIITLLYSKSGPFSTRFFFVQLAAFLYFVHLSAVTAWLS